MSTEDFTGSTHGPNGNANLIVAVLTLFSVIATLTFFGAILEDLIPVQPVDKAALLQVYKLPIEEFRPEPVERAQYLVSVGFFLPLCAFYFLIYRQVIARLSWIWQWRIHQFLSLLLPLVLIELVWGAFKRVAIPFFHAAGILQQTMLTLTGALAVCLLRTGRPLFAKWKAIKRLGEAAYFTGGAVVILFMMAGVIFNEWDPWVKRTHFQAYYDAVVQAYLGKVVLVNNSAQYGLYPAFLAPIFHLIHPPTVLAFTLTAAVLLAAAYTALLVVLHRVMRSKVLAFCTFITISFYTRIGPAAYFGPEPYFQYIPHRILFPMLFLVPAWFYLSSSARRGRIWLFTAASIIASAAVLWSMDSGMIVLGAWAFLLLAEGLRRVRKHSARRTVKVLASRGLAAAGICLGVFLAFSVLLYAESGSWPAWGNLSQYSTLFYRSGYFMAPMPGLVYPWAVLILVYMAALYQTIRALFEPGKEAEAQASFSAQKYLFYGTVAVLGIGLFSYYQGRSAEENLIGLSWPALFLIGAFTDDIWTGLQRQLAPSRVPVKAVFDNAGSALLFGFLFLFLFGSIFAVVDVFPRYMEIVANRQQDLRSGLPPSLHRQVEFIRANAEPDDPVLILSANAPVLSLYSGYPRPLDVPGFSELMLVEDFGKIEDFLAHPPSDAKIFYDVYFTQFVPAEFGGVEARDSRDGLILYTAK